MNNTLRDRREDADLSQAELAEGVGVTRQTINAIERERYDPSLELAFELSAYFGCRIEDLFHPKIDADGADD